MSRREEKDCSRGIERDIVEMNPCDVAERGCRGEYWACVVSYCIILIEMKEVSFYRNV